MSEQPKDSSVRLGDLDLSPLANSFVFTISREQAIMEGLEKPTPEEVERYNVGARERWEKSVAEWAVLDAALAELDAIADPLGRKVLDLHAIADDEAVCDACSFDSDDPYDEAWPCPTVKIVAKHFDVTLPDGYFGHRPDDEPHEMPPEGYQRFVPPLARWRSAALGAALDREVGL